MGRWSGAVAVVIHFSSALASTGCAGELSDAQKEAPDGAGGSGGAGSGGSNTGGSAGNGGSPESCVLAMTKAKSCAIVGCHGGTMPAAQLLLTDEALHQPKAALVDKTNKGMMPGCTPGMYKLIDGANPEKSLFYTKLTAQPPCGERMPSTGAYLSDAEMSCVLDWIKSVAGVP